MDSEFAFTYTLPFTLSREDTVLTVGFCLSKKNFDALKTERHDFLHPKENNYFNNLCYPKRQESYLRGRYCAKLAISALLQENNPTLLSIENGIFQQPVVSHTLQSSLQVSISHTDNMATALAFPETYLMAIDIETICDKKIAALQTQLTTAEQQLANKLLVSHASQLTVLWTIKEALSKILKCGFAVNFEILEIATFTSQAGFIISEFKNFYQYKALSFLFADTACSIVYPKKTRLDLDIVAIQRLFSKRNYA